MIIQNGKISMVKVGQVLILFPVSSSQRYLEGPSNATHCANMFDNGTVGEEKQLRISLCSKLDPIQLVVYPYENLILVYRSNCFDFPIFIPIFAILSTRVAKHTVHFTGYPNIEELYIPVSRTLE